MARKEEWQKSECAQSFQVMVAITMRGFISFLNHYRAWSMSLKLSPFLLWAIEQCWLWQHRACCLGWFVQWEHSAFSLWKPVSCLICEFQGYFVHLVVRLARVDMWRRAGEVARREKKVGWFFLLFFCFSLVAFFFFFFLLIKLHCAVIMWWLCFFILVKPSKHILSSYINERLD